MKGMTPKAKHPEPLSDIKGHQVHHRRVPRIGTTFFTYERKKHTRDVWFLTVTDVAEYRRAKDNTLSFLIAYRDKSGNYYSSGMKSKSLVKHGKTVPDIHRQRRTLKFTELDELHAAPPLGPHGIGVSHKNVPAIGELFWTYPENDMNKPKLYVKVTDVRPFTSPADGTSQYRIYYTCKDNKQYASCLSSFKLVNLTDNDKHERAIKEHRKNVRGNANAADE